MVPAAVAKAATRMFCKWVMCNPGSLSSYACQDPLLTQFFATLGMTNGVTRYQLDKCLDEFYEEYKTELAGMLKNQHFSLSADAWTSKHVNLGYKLIGACINTTNASTLLDFTATSGEKQDAEFILETLLAMLRKVEDGGVDVQEHFIGIIQDGEAACQKAGRQLQEMYPKSLAIICQAHAMSLAIKDLISRDGLIRWVLNHVHLIITAVNNSKELMVALHKAQIEKYGKVKALRIGCETRFGSKVLEASDVLASKEALQQLPVGEIGGPLGIIPNANFWCQAAIAMELLQPLADVIHHIEGDKPLLSQVSRTWDEILDLMLKWGIKHRQAPPRWLAGFQIPEELGELATDTSLADIIDKRRKKCHHAAFSLARLLDLRLLEEKEHQRYTPNVKFLDQEEMECVQAVLRRLVGGGSDGNAAVAELKVWIQEGTNSERVDGLLKEAHEQDGWKMVVTVERVLKVWHNDLRGAIPILVNPGEATYPLLAKAADRLLRMHATSCSSERLWSIMRWTYRKNRTRLDIEKAKKMVAISMHERMKRKRAEADPDEMDYLLDCMLDD